MKLDKVYRVLQDRYKYAQDFETANEEDYVLEAIEEVKEIEDKLKRRGVQIADLKNKVKELKKEVYRLLQQEEAYAEKQ